jgi:hypothetical protein
MSRSYPRALGIALAAAAFQWGCSTMGIGASQRDFATPEQAAAQLAAAARADAPGRMLDVLGPDGEKLVQSGDPVADHEGRQRFVKAYDTAHHIELAGAGGATLVIGPENWPLPIPLVKSGDRWHFDTAAGVQKILDRRIGRNELNVIEVCRAYVVAQREYASVDRLGDGLHEYARHFESSPGRHDGLHWVAEPGQEESPLGPLVVKARAEGYGESGFHPAPYHGYFYRILTRQGPHAPGGARDYVVNGHMTGGFALLAMPARWGDSGVMTFIVNQDGIVFEKNLGPDTETLAREIHQFDPDSSWKVVPETPAPAPRAPGS